MTALAEYAVIFLSLRAVKTSSLMKLGLGCVALILIFGFIGDLRSGAEAFKELALPTKQYPDWLPSGVLWVYIYVTTPINNLLFTAHTFSPLNSLLIPNTAATLFPSVLRTAIYGNELGQAVSGNLVTAAFNVSTAYLGPFEDYGMFGIIMFSAFAALTSQYFWYRASLRDILIFAVLTQCLLFTLFYNLFLALPVIAQLFWLAYFFMPRFNFGSKTSAAPYAI
jgi:oligosaccharide repeat unit polymerase